jgi:hypothetical protein
MIPTSKEEFKAILDRQQQSRLSIRDFCSNMSIFGAVRHTWHAG